MRVAREQAKGFLLRNHPYFASRLGYIFSDWLNTASGTGRVIELCDELLASLHEEGIPADPWETELLCEIKQLPNHFHDVVVAFMMRAAALAMRQTALESGAITAAELSGEKRGDTAGAPCASPVDEKSTATTATQTSQNVPESSSSKSQSELNEKSAEEEREDIARSVQCSGKRPISMMNLVEVSDALVIGGMFPTRMLRRAAYAAFLRRRQDEKSASEGKGEMIIAAITAATVASHAGLSSTTTTTSSSLSCSKWERLVRAGTAAYTTVEAMLAAVVWSLQAQFIEEWLSGSLDHDVVAIDGGPTNTAIATQEQQQQVLDPVSYLTRVERAAVDDRYHRVLRSFSPAQVTETAGSVASQHASGAINYTLETLPSYKVLSASYAHFISSTILPPPRASSSTSSSSGPTLRGLKGARGATDSSSSASSMLPKAHAVDALDVADAAAVLVHSVKIVDTQTTHSVMLYLAQHLPERLAAFLPPNATKLLVSLADAMQAVQAAGTDKAVKGTTTGGTTASADETHALARTILRKVGLRDAVGGPS